MENTMHMSGLAGIIQVLKRWKWYCTSRSLHNWTWKLSKHNVKVLKAAAEALKVKLEEAEVAHQKKIEAMEKEKECLVENLERQEKEAARELEFVKKESEISLTERLAELKRVKEDHYSEVDHLKHVIGDLERQIGEARVEIVKHTGILVTTQKEKDYFEQANSRLEADKASLEEEKQVMFLEKVHLDKIGIEHTYTIERLERQLIDNNAANTAKYDAMVDASQKVNAQLERLQQAEREAQGKAAAEFDHALQAGQEQVQSAYRHFESQEAVLRAELAARTTELENCKRNLNEALERGDKLQVELNNGIATDRDVVLGQIEAVHAKYRDEYAAKDAMIATLKE